MKLSIISVVAPLALGFLASTATASDLTLNGQASVQLPPGSSMEIELTGNPGLPAFLVLDVDNGPMLLAGEIFPIGVTPIFRVLKVGMTDGTGLFKISATLPANTTWLGVDLYFAGAIVDPADPNGYDIANGTDLLGVPETCTPAVQAACIAMGLTACSSGTPDCGPPINLCTPAIMAACDAAGFCSCDPLTGACENILGAGGQCCMPSEQDSCGVCFGNGQGLIGCPGNCGAGVGTCVCDVCNCPPPFFGAACTCTETSVLYNGFFQSSFIPPTTLTLMQIGSDLSGEGWIKPTKVGSPIYTRLGVTGQVWAFSAGVVGVTSVPNRLRLYNGNGCSTCTLDGVGAIPLNTWTHVAFTWDGATNIATFYINGVFDSSGIFVPRAPSSAQLLFGQLGSNYYGGNLDDMRLWSTVRTPAEILANYDKSITGVGVAGLIFNHNMQKWTPGDLECIDYSDNSLDLVHNLFAAQAANVAPGPLPITPEACPSNCNGAGSCSCGVCSCFSPSDTSYDCSVSGGGG